MLLKVLRENYHTYNLRYKATKKSKTTRKTATVTEKTQANTTKAKAIAMKKYTRHYHIIYKH